MIYTTPACLVCHKTSVVELEIRDVERWKRGEHVQHVWPDKTPEERELLQTGTHPGCWDQMFQEDER